MFQPRNGSIGISEPFLRKREKDVSTPQRFDWNRRKKGVRECKSRFQPRNGSIGISVRARNPRPRRVSTPQRFGWNPRRERKKRGDRGSPPQQFNWNTSLVTANVLATSFNPATVRLESFLRCQLRHQCCFNPATVRLEFVTKRY